MHSQPRILTKYFDPSGFSRMFQLDEVAASVFAPSLDKGRRTVDYSLACSQYMLALLLSATLLLYWSLAAFSDAALSVACLLAALSGHLVAFSQEMTPL